MTPIGEMSADELAPLPKPLGLIGLDDVGCATARKIADAGQRIICFDAAPEARKSLAAAHPLIEIATNHIDVAAQCDVVLLRGADRDAKLSNLLGTEDRPGVATGLAQAALIIDLAPASDDLGPRLAALLGEAAIGYVEAHILSAPPSSESDSLIFVGGWPEFATRAARILRPLGSCRVVGHLGAPKRAASIVAEIKTLTGALVTDYDLTPDVLALH